VMTREVICAQPDASILSIAQLMATHRISSVVVATSSPELAESSHIPIGIITERDLVQAQALDINLESCTAEMLMSAPVFAVQPEDSLWAVQQLMEERSIRRLVVMGGAGELVGIVTQSNLLQALNPLELYNLAEVLEKKVVRLEAEKLALLQRKATKFKQQAEARLQQSEQRFATLAATAPVGIFRTDTHGCCIYVNDRFCQTTGCTAESAIGQGWQQSIHPDDLLRTTIEWQRSLQEEYPFQMEYRLQQSERWVYTQSISERDTNGEVIGYIGTMIDISDRKQAEHKLQQLNQELELKIEERTQELWQDITLRKQAEAQLQEQEQFLRSIYNGVNYSIFVIDVLDAEQFIYVDWNAAAEKVTGITTHEIFAKSPEAIYGKGLGSLKQQRLQKCLALGTPFSYEEQLELPDKSYSWWFTTLNPLKDQTGKIYRIVGTKFDISDRKRAEAQLQRSNEELARATRLKDEFLANMSHELRTPLNAILGITEVLQEEVFGQINPEQAKSLQTLDRSGTHLLELINDILDVAKIESGQIELDLQPTNIAVLCQSSMAFIKQQALKKRIQFNIQLPANLPDLLVDERRIRQVLINLLNNAVKFTPEGGRITLEVNPLDRDNDLQIAVVDTGIGIASEHINKLFQPFIQIDSALNRQYQGTGLGLALVKRIVELHAGQVGLTSEVGCGSRFTMTLPYLTVSPAPTDLEQALESQILPKENLPASKPVILLAEDNQANIDTMSSYLKAKGYSILLAKNGQDAVFLANSQHPDIILMDIQMPGMDGLEAMQRIRANDELANIPIIALTALAMTGDRERCLAAGANEYLSKPVRLKELTHTIQHVLQQPDRQQLSLTHQ
jgi:PAS domain S-box-containing protein